MSSRPFDYNGECYRSIKDFCERTGTDYWAMRRLCRKYIRASRDPAVAAAWLLGDEKLSFATEPRTPAYMRDLELNKLRQLESYARRSYRRDIERVRRRRELLDSIS